MGLLDRLIGNDRKLAATKYAGRESASDRAARVRQHQHRARGIQEAAQQGQAWEDADRQRERTRGRR
ncbi:hypothetical protein [Streptomyces chryseus]|uniref:Uncharacterized protein n=1 Tax=Streptomyces chryseus TaxID=68186 RepID=A0ABQ3DM90_9ACTN|nr:hypothetical protein [Streptomyces chryseus]GHA94272.1 hypothetical protein GCM10010346_16280 [Streptomyces chryseus]